MTLFANRKHIDIYYTSPLKTNKYPWKIDVWKMKCSFENGPFFKGHVLIFAGVSTSDWEDMDQPQGRTGEDGTTSCGRRDQNRRKTPYEYEWIQKILLG